MAAQKFLNIINLDIKPDNIIITQQDQLKVIDMSTFAFTAGLHGKPGELLARSILENQIQKSLRGGRVALEEFYEFDDPAYRHTHIASPELLVAWTQVKCKDLLPTSAAGICSTIQNFSEL